MAWVSSVWHDDAIWKVCVWGAGVEEERGEVWLRRPMVDYP